MSLITAKGMLNKKQQQRKETTAQEFKNFVCCRQTLVRERADAFKNVFRKREDVGKERKRGNKCDVCVCMRLLIFSMHFCELMSLFKCVCVCVCGSVCMG